MAQLITHNTPITKLSFRLLLPSYCWNIRKIDSTTLTVIMPQKSKPRTLIQQLRAIHDAEMKGIDGKNAPKNPVNKDGTLHKGLACNRPK